MTPFTRLRPLSLAPCAWKGSDGAWNVEIHEVDGTNRLCVNLEQAAAPYTSRILTFVDGGIEVAKARAERILRALRPILEAP